MSKKKHTVTINFKNQQIKDVFLTWLSESGEQDFFLWVDEAQPSDDENTCTVEGLDYDGDVVTVK